MPYLVDGHNLIPHIPGLSLKDLDDEQTLIGLLGKFASSRRANVEVYFDQASPSRAGSQAFGRVRAYYIRQGTTADQAIISRLHQMGGSAKNWTVVSSDRVIQAEARSMHSKVLPSPEFASQLGEELSRAGGGCDKGEDPSISESEVDYWMDQFNGS
jgi:uncharacterized protein